jgi:hypothetical protein
MSALPYKQFLNCADVEGVETICFFCGNRFDESAQIIPWYGYHRVITLHKKCAEALATNLLNDAKRPNDHNN